MGQIKAILFDFGGTLDHEGVDWFTRLYGMITASGGSLTREVFEVYAGAAADDLAGTPDAGVLTLGETVYRLCADIHRSAREQGGDGELRWRPGEVAAGFVAEAEGHLRRNRELLRELRRSFRLGCISNNWGNTAGWCREFGLAECFETIIDSTVVGASKPDATIFRTALEEMQLPAAACAYVGDWYPCDVVGAHGAGMTAIWLTQGEGAGADMSLVDYRIARLGDLRRLDLSAAG